MAESLAWVSAFLSTLKLAIRHKIVQYIPNVWRKMLRFVILWLKTATNIVDLVQAQLARALLLQTKKG